MSKRLNITDEKTGQKWCVRVVYTGDKYGREMCLTHKEDRPLLEFYDSDYDFAKDTDGVVLGQFVSRYYLATIEGHCNGLDLCGYEPKWKMGSNCLSNVLKWAIEEVEA